MKKSSIIITLLLLILTTSSALAQAPEGEEYIIQPGDTLNKIAEAAYGDGSFYPGIVDATNAKADEDDTFTVIQNPNLIVPGQKLWLPTLAEAATTDTIPEDEVTTPTTPMPDIADYPHLQQAGKFFEETVLPVVVADCLDAVDGTREFPLAEPDYTSKQTRDLSPFETALADLTPERTAELDGLVLGTTIPELQTLLDAGDLTSEELVIYYVDRIQRYDIDKLNSVMELNPEALDIARTLDEERAAGTVQGPLHGIPVLLKDNIATGDQMHTTAGAAAMQDWVADRDAFLVQQIRDAGGIIMGKANLSEWANYMDPCMPSGFSAVGGQTRHPYGPFDPLGSSSGSAVSAAANLTTVSVGSETSGSLIQPSRVNSLVGMRPSQGLISRDYVVPLGANLDTPGPMGRSVTDIAILLNAMTGVDPNDPKTSDAAALAGADFTQYLDLERAKELKVGVVMFEQRIKTAKEAVEASLGQTLSEDEVKAFTSVWVEGSPFQAIEALESQGIEVVQIMEADLPPSVDTAQPQLNYGFQDDFKTFAAGLGAPAPVATLAEVVAFNDEDMANRAPYNDRFVKWSVETELTAADQAQIVAEAQAYAEAWMTSLVETYDVDVLIAGTLYAGNAGAAGVPALTIPAGLDATGKPSGIIVTGPYLSDPDLLAVGYALEQALQGRVEPDLDTVISTFPQ
ncbi:MAG: LysM peptidoglycan-binding domain-containing protein [Anaerolineales bacterium]|nr:LysM peptidoglycan-binding domain-containing protein [Anaerolineales bacterium]